MEWAVIAAAALLAGLLKGATGLGEAIPLGVVGIHVLDPPELLSLIAITDVVAGLFASRGHWTDHSNDERRLYPGLLVGLGLGLGALAVVHEHQERLTTLFGIGVLVVGLFLLTLGYGRTSRSVAWRHSGAVVGGFSGGLTGIDGPPLALALLMTSRGDHRPLLIRLLLMSAILRLMVLALIGMVNVAVVVPALLLLPVMLLGIALGTSRAAVWSPRRLTRATAIVCVLGGAAAVAS